MTADVIYLPRPNTLDNAPTGSLATCRRRLYAKGGPGWICLNGDTHAEGYARWVEALDGDAVLIREGI